MPKRILMIAYHFPPVRGSSGVQRTLHFSRHLAREHGWEPTVLTVHPRAYPSTAPDQLDDIGEGVEVIRAFALDTARHLSLLGRYPRMLALPDKWMSWKPFAIRAARRAHAKTPFDAIWSTFPIATAHAIGLALSRQLDVPWIADFRDSMTEEGYPTDPVQRRAYLAIEREVVERCHRAVFTTPGARAMYAARYPSAPDERWAIIPNGFDERSFVHAEGVPTTRATGEPITLVHSGLLYRSERDPTCFFDAIAELKRRSVVDGSRLRIILRASGDEDYHREEIRKRGVDDVISLESAKPYREALREMLDADGLLLFQAANCNHQIPAKAYEYVRARRPVFGLTDPRGDTAQLLRESGGATIVQIDDASAIADGLQQFLARIADGTHPIATNDFVDAQSRRARTAELARLLEGLPVSGSNRAT